MPKIKNITKKLLITGIILLFCAFCFITRINCPILTLTGVRCLGCGMTRAMLSALKFDFAAAFSYHIMFPAVPLLYLCFIFDGKLFKNKKLNILLYVVLLIGFLTNWGINFL